MSLNNYRADNEKIDIFIPAIEKDLKTLPHVIDAVRKYVMHPIGKIMIVAPPTSRMIDLCNKKNCTFINENYVLPINKSNIEYKNSKWDRSGWLFQQLLKLNCDKFASQQSILVIDADTVFIRPHVFRMNKKTVYYCRYWSHQEYFRAYKRLFGKKVNFPHSFVTHYMLFEKSKLARFRKKIESKQKRNWYSAIIKCTNKASKVGFSEFESYGNFIYSKYPGSFVIKKAANKCLYTNASSVSSSQRQVLSHRFKSLSFHKRRAYRR